MARCLRMYQMALRSLLTIPLDMSRGLNYSHEGWVSLQPHDGHTPMSIFSDNKCWMICLRLTPRCKQTTCTVLPSPCGLPLCSAHIRNLSQCLWSESSKRKNTLLSNAVPDLRNKNGFCLMVHKLRPLVLMIIFLLTEDDYWNNDEMYWKGKTEVLVGMFVLLIHPDKYVKGFRFPPSVSFYSCSASVLAIWEKFIWVVKWWEMKGWGESVIKLCVGKNTRNCIQYFLTLVLFTFCTCCILRCLVCIVVSCLVRIFIVVLCVLLLVVLCVLL